jgi:hypothetical protein
MLLALPVTGILWAIAIIDHFVLRSLLPRFALVAVGIIIPIVYYENFFGIPDRQKELAGKRIVEQSDAAVVQWVTDEPLVDSAGPIGVRLRFQIMYPKGLDLSSKDAPSVELHGIVRSNQDLMLLARRKEVSPPADKGFAVGVYTITEDFLPAFMPKSLLPVGHWSTEQRKSVPDRCFRWPLFEKRADIEGASAQVFKVWIAPALTAGDPIKTPTTHSYRLADFIDSAIHEGATDCNS